jgi:hypothetical protein
MKDEKAEINKENTIFNEFTIYFYAINSRESHS